MSNHVFPSQSPPKEDMFPDLAPAPKTVSVAPALRLLDDDGVLLDLSSRMEGQLKWAEEMILFWQQNRESRRDFLVVSQSISDLLQSNVTLTEAVLKLNQSLQQIAKMVRKKK